LELKLIIELLLSIIDSSFVILNLIIFTFKGMNRIENTSIINCNY